MQTLQSTWLIHARNLAHLHDMGLERLFLEHIRALQFMDADLAMDTAPPMQEDFVMTEERLQIYKWLRDPSQFGRIGKNG